MLQTNGPVPAAKPSMSGMARPASVLPPGALRRPISPSTARQTPAQDGHDTPIIDVDLVGKDRYDPASKTFSYVPAKSVQEYFTTPRKPTQLVQKVEDEDGREVIESRMKEKQNGDKWEDDIDRLLREHGSTRESHKMPLTAPRSDHSKQITSDIHNADREKTRLEGCKAPKTRKTKYGSYRTLNDDAYSSDLDELYDPDFYMTYTSAAEKNGSTQRLSRSVTSTPLLHKSKKWQHHFGSETYDSLTEADNPDNWLEQQLDKLRYRREVLDPDIQRRKRQEKRLLEELKHVHNDRMAARGKNEADYSVEGVGTRKTDPLEEYRREQPRHGPRHVTGKPPTPPPRDRSRTPSPKTVSLSQTRKPNSTHPYHQQISSPPPYNQLQEQRHPEKSRYSQLAMSDSALNDGDDEADVSGRGEFDHLQAIVNENGKTAFEERHKSSLHSVSQSPKSILKRHNQQLQHTNSLDQFDGKKLSLSSVETMQRTDTPAFPVKRDTPLPFHPLLFDGACPPTRPHFSRNLHYRSPSPSSMYYGQSRPSSVASLEPMEVINHHPVFVKDTSKYWYKPHISREEAIKMLKEKPPGTFVVRDSNSFRGAFGLALRVATPPPGVQSKSKEELVRHFLIEPSRNGVKLKGCNNEPVFGTLSALVYQHSITQLALPCKLLLPDYDPSLTPEHLDAAQALLEQGAACNLIYILSCDTECLTGPEAVRRCVSQAFALTTHKQIIPVSVHFKVSTQGVTVTDNTRKLFFRRHYPASSVTFAGIDPEDRRWEVAEGTTGARLFGFVARKTTGPRSDNACHIFAELDPEQPATAVVNFITKVMMANHGADQHNTRHMNGQ